jgi:hypothetical protein
MMFDVTHPVPLDAALPAPTLLDGTNAWAAASAGLVRVDLRTGQAGPPATPSGELPALPDPTFAGPMTVSKPVITGTGSDRVVLAAYSVIVRGSGTTASPPAVDVVAADPVSGAKRFDVTIPLPAALQASGQQPIAMVVPAVPTATGPGSSIAVLAIGGPGDTYSDTWTSFGIDLTSRQVVWTTTRFLAQVIDDGIVVGLQSIPATSVQSTRSDAFGRVLTDGATRWTVQHVDSIGFASPHLVTLSGSNTDPANGFGQLGFLTFTAPSDGHTVEAVDNSKARSAQINLSCFYDEVSLTVCAYAAQYQLGDQPVFAFDAAHPHDTLWQLPDPGHSRVAPTITAVWHGAVYGFTENGPVVLDARTGADRNDHSGAAPGLVDPYFAVDTVATGFNVMSLSRNIYPTSG